MRRNGAGLGGAEPGQGRPSGGISQAGSPAPGPGRPSGSSFSTPGPPLQSVDGGDAPGDNPGPPGRFPQLCGRELHRCFCYGVPSWPQFTTGCRRPAGSGSPKPKPSGNLRFSTPGAPPGPFLEPRFHFAFVPGDVTGRRVGQDGQPHLSWRGRSRIYLSTFELPDNSAAAPWRAAEWFSTRRTALWIHQIITLMLANDGVLKVNKRPYKVCMS